MNLRDLNDQVLLAETKRLVENERRMLTQILHHFRELERRKLFSDLGFSSLFDYAVRELKYSEGQAVRRIQAMRLMKELPEVEEKIATGKLSLTHLTQAQNYFREVQKKPLSVLDSKSPQNPIDRIEKLKVLARLENTSTREGEKILLKLQPKSHLPKERARVITDEHTEVRFVMNSALKDQLENVRALLGPKGATMNLAELVSAMASLSQEMLKAKKFGKKRVQGVQPQQCVTQDHIANQDTPPPAPTVPKRTYIRHIPRSVKHAVWIRDRGTCVKCGSRKMLNYDHIHPVALGGTSTVQNMQLLCFHCNQRRAIKTFGFNFPKKINFKNPDSARIHPQSPARRGGAPLNQQLGKRPLSLAGDENIFRAVAASGCLGSGYIQLKGRPPFLPEFR